MEGVTSYIFRNAQHEFFHHIDKYFTPFIAANQNGKLKSKEKSDILPENNQGLVIVPQILTNHSADFLLTTKKLQQYGYQEINLNLGCPAGTVVAKGKGSGFLAEKEQLDRFLDEIFHGTDAKISIKTRLGKDSPDEFYELIQIYNQYPLEELIIHPRIQKDFYKNTPNLEVFREALTLSKHPICYNGDIFTKSDYEKFQISFPSVHCVMFGRGLIANPGLTKSLSEDWAIDKETLHRFHDRILEDYQAILSGDVNVLYKMKELWFYMMPMFKDCDKHAKKIRKCSRLSEYNEIVTSLFQEKVLAVNPGFIPK